MSVSLRVMPPITDATTFEHDCRTRSRMALVGTDMGPHPASRLAARGLKDGPGTPPGLRAVATQVFSDQDAMDAATNVSGPAPADVPNFTPVTPTALVGEVIG